MKKSKAHKAKNKPKNKVKSNPSVRKSGIRPIGERVLVRPFTEEALRQAQGKEHFGIILPDSMKEEKSAQGKVVAVGDGKKVSVGDVVVFSKYGYDEVEYKGEEYYLIKEENILAVIN